MHSDWSNVYQNIRITILANKIVCLLIMSLLCLSFHHSSPVKMNNLGLHHLHWSFKYSKLLCNSQKKKPL